MLSTAVVQARSDDDDNDDDDENSCFCCFLVVVVASAGAAVKYQSCVSANLLQGLSECSSTDTETNDVELELWQESRLMVCLHTTCFTVLLCLSCSCDVFYCFTVHCCRLCIRNYKIWCVKICCLKIPVGFLINSDHGKNQPVVVLLGHMCFCYICISSTAY